MTFRETNRVIHEGGALEHAEFRVLAIIAGVVNEPNGWICDKAPETFAREANMSWPQVRRTLNRLVKLGWIEPVHESRGRVHSTYRWLGQPCAERTVDDDSNRALSAQQPCVERTAAAAPSMYRKERETNSPPTPPQAGGEPDDFEAFWLMYPRKQQRLSAEREYTKALRRGVTHDEILDGLRRNLSDLECLDDQFVPSPKRWLRDGRWMDEPTGTAARFVDDIGFDSPARLLDAEDRAYLARQSEEAKQ